MTALERRAGRSACRCAAVSLKPRSGAHAYELKDALDGLWAVRPLRPSGFPLLTARSKESTRSRPTAGYGQVPMNLETSSSRSRWRKRTHEINYTELAPATRRESWSVTLTRGVGPLPSSPQLS
jgi:hypothetical protein